ncbi:MAG: mRNA surveillance protein pelota [Nanoarchaeota archaeon]
MEIINADFKKGIVKLRVEDAEDLWYLSHLIDPGDLVKGKTTRKIRIGAGENAKSVKKTLTLKIEAETVELTEAALRINGLVKEGPEDVPKDSYHSIALESGSELLLQKSRWMEYQKQKLNESSEKKYNYLLCLFDREEALFALTKKNGYEVLAKIQGEVEKKAKKSEIKKDFQLEIINALETYSRRYSPERIIIASPAFFKEYLLEKITSSELKKKIVTATCSDISERSLDEVMRSPELAAVLKHSRARMEQLLIEELLAEINKGEKATYGLKEVKEAVNSGAVLKLLITDNFIRRKRTENKFAEIDALMTFVDGSKGEVHVLSSEHDAGRKLDGLGGIAAMLRYKIYSQV